MVSKVDLVIFHSPCFDGGAGAWVAEYFCYEMLLPKPELFGCKPGQESYDFPEMKGKSVAVIDICFNRETMLKMNEECAEFVVLDHHVTSRDKMEGLNFCVIDMDRSGCQIAWDYFFPTRTKERPRFIDYIADRDLWKWELEVISKPFNAALFSKWGNCPADWTIGTMWGLSRFTPKDYADFIQYGENCLEFQQKQINIAIKHAVKCSMKTLDGTLYQVWASDTRLHRSEIGAALARRDDCDFAVMYSYHLPKNEWWISLRSESAEKADVGNIAAMFPRGGGHACAAGFTWKGDIRTLLDPV